ncbi:hypothetical protein [Paracoccus sp. (in: a-proteobacteria)]|uniref:hypothetical protein n=1 Tax=Paracoccus sp. TaxID=267 RepID=UPI0026E0D222|nr:hypothetical protein [Paracoccus sp. (in: a-proteobacteria)]MDO5648865.1 hypothetical protein [Paracoccus sp. (in: a-proteobacteria)]
MRAGGARDDQVADMVDQIAPRPTVSLPAKLRPVIRLAMAMIGQWRLAGGGMMPARPVAFDLHALDVAARWLELTPSPKLLRQMQIIEAEALRLMEAPDDN